MSKQTDKRAFLEQLRMWDRPEKELYGRPLDADTETDALLDKLFSNPRAGFLVE